MESTVSSEQKEQGKIELSPNFWGPLVGILAFFNGFILLIHIVFIVPLRNDIKGVEPKIDSVEIRLREDIDRVQQDINRLEQTINQRFDNLLIQLIENQ